jgi:hypothetical protein
MGIPNRSHIKQLPMVSSTPREFNMIFIHTLMYAMGTSISSNIKKPNRKHKFSIQCIIYENPFVIYTIIQELKTKGIIIADIYERGGGCSTISP